MVHNKYIYVIQDRFFFYVVIEPCRKERGKIYFFILKKYGFFRAPNNDTVALVVYVKNDLKSKSILYKL